MQKQRIALFLLAAALLASGLYNKEPLLVLRKATTICLECIGLG